MSFNLKEVPDPVTNSFLRGFMNNVIIPTVCRVRNELSTIYDVNSRTYKNYRGLCDVASVMVADGLKRYIEIYFQDPSLVHIHIIHGEQKHNPRISSLYWELQHTWIQVKIRDRVIYVDPTSSQFQDIYPDIPDFYVLLTPPKWYLADRDSLVFGFGSQTNRKIKIPARIYTKNKMRWKRIGICEMLVYHLWASISDMIHALVSTICG